MRILDSIISSYLSRQITAVHSLKQVNSSAPLEIPLPFDDAFWYRGDGGTQLACWVVEPGMWTVEIVDKEPERSRDEERWFTYQAPPRADDSRPWVVIMPDSEQRTSPEFRGTILLLHGWKDSVLERPYLRGLAVLLAGDGYRVVLPELRGYGRSRGDYISFGLHEQYDIQLLLDELENRYSNSGPVGILGHSYGGNIAMMATALDDRIRAAVVVSAPHDLREILPVSVKRYEPRLAWLVSSNAMDMAMRKANKRTGLDFSESNAMLAIQKTDRPVLLIHGGKDITIPPYTSEMIRDARPQNTEHKFYPDEAHASLFVSKLTEIHIRCTRFFGTHL